jgi:hypothetical protein
MLIAIYALLSIAMAVLAKRVWHVLAISAVMSAGVTGLSLDVIKMSLDEGHGPTDLTLNSLFSFWTFVWLGTFLPALVVYWLKRLMSEPSPAN